MESLNLSNGAKAFRTGHSDGYGPPAPNTLLRFMFAGLMASCSTPALAVGTCGMSALGGGSSGPPSISATEASTTQVLEEIRRRTAMAQQQAHTIPVSDTTVVAAANGEAATTSSSSSSAGTSSGAAKPTPQVTQGAPAKPRYAKIASAHPSEEAYEYSAGSGGYERITGSWGQGYLDYERHTNIAPGQDENRTRTARTAGYMSGTDWTWIQPAASQAVQFGVFSGYNASFVKFGNTTFNSGDGFGGENQFSRTNSKQEISGEFAGAYLAAVDGPATYDLTFKADIFDLDQSSLLTQLNGGCGNVATESGSASVNNYTIAADASYKHPLTANSWLEPTIGIQYTITDYGNDPTTLSGSIAQNGLPNGASNGQLGLKDGTVLRLLGGIRYGDQGALPNGGIWTVVTGAFIYSDVLITGFDFNPGTTAGGFSAGTTVFPVDEGKIRGLGQIISTWDYSDNWSYLLAGEIRGGEDLFGVGGRVGARYRW